MNEKTVLIVAKIPSAKNGPVLPKINIYETINGIRKAPNLATPLLNPLPVALRGVS